MNFASNLDYTAGWEALARSRAAPESTFFHAKRHLGSDKIFNVHGKSIRAEAIVALIMSHLKKNAEEYLGQTLDEVLISAPANFTITQTNSLLRACDIAQLKVRRVIGEPCAASLVVQDLFRLTNRREGTVLVLDLGGGTIDIAIINFGDGVAEVLAVVGDNSLGGIDYDEALFVFSVERLLGKAIMGNDIGFSDTDLYRLRHECERAKIALGSRHETTVIVQNIEVAGQGMIDVDLLITRACY